MFYNEYDLIITNNYIKEEILKEVSTNNFILKPKIITMQELKSILIGNISNDSIYYLMTKYNLDYNNASLILKNIYFNTAHYNDLLNEGLIHKFNNFNYKNILLINEYVDPYLVKIMDNPKLNLLDDNKNMNNKNIYEFIKIEDEVYFIASRIYELLANDVDINNIKIVNANEEYNNILRKVFSLFNIPINIKDNYKLYQTKTTKLFLDNLEKYNNIEKAFLNVPKNNVYNKLVNILNKFTFINFDNNAFNIIKEELKKASLKEDTYINAIECISMNEVFNKDNYYFILGLNEGVYPRVFKDDDYYNDSEKEELGMFKSVDKAKHDKELFYNILSRFKNITLSYKLNSDFNEYFPTYLIADLNLNIIKDIEENYIYSNVYNKIKLSEKLDDYINYNIEDDNLSLLYFNYNALAYKSYSNKYENINKDLYLSKNSNPRLSYSSLNNYFLCPFKYYLIKVLKLDDFEESIHTVIGNLFHKVLEKIYEDDFNFDEEYNKFIEKIKDKKTLFFVNVLKVELQFIINTIKKIEKNTSLSNVLNEESIEIKLKDATIYGIIDKVLYENINGERVGIIIDYKTGSIDSNLNNITDGINLQLPTYAYLKYKKDPNFNVVGLYYQEILHNYTLDSEEEEREDKLKLQGYSISDTNILEKIDSSYINSNMIKSMKVSSKGFYKYVKLMNKEDFLKVISVAEDKILTAKDKILNREFKIEPKRLKNENISCKYCPFSDICFYTEDDVLDLSYKSIEDILGEK